MSIGRMARIAMVLGWSDFLLKYRGSFLGYLWSLIVPLTKFLVIYHVFRPFVGGSVEHYPLYLFLGLICWEYFALVTTGCMAMLHEKESIITRVPFPRLLLAFSFGWTSLLIFLSYFLIFVAVALLAGIHPVASWIYGGLVLIQLACCALGTGMVLAAWSLRFRDIPHLWSVMLQILFWLTPIAYLDTYHAPLSVAARDVLHPASLASLSGLFNAVVRFQPLSMIIHDARRVFLYPEVLGVPSAVHALVLTVPLIAFFVAATWIFHRRSRGFVQEY